ncbi:hypothetical protein [Streptococcus phage P738]|nr:hypothetical protein [Streptococcus phage P738]
MSKVTPIYSPVLLTFFDEKHEKMESRTINGYEEAVRIATEETMWNEKIHDYTIEDLH